MTGFKKVLSVFMAAVMLFCVMSVGMVGVAAGMDFAAQYNALADALKNEHVRELTNYTISNTTLQNGTSGFNTEANGFAYEHRVTASDNASGDILKAANIFYYIAEHLISTVSGVGYYDAATLVKEIERNVKTRFDNAGETFYEDFYGNRYFPTDEEIDEYNNVVSLIQAADREVSQVSLTAFNIYFMEKDYFDYYNVSTVLKYFVGNTLKINAGNWYHRYSFVVQTSVDTCLAESGGIDSFADTKLPIRTAVYEFDYTRTFNETKARAYYAFAAPSLARVWENYSEEFGLIDRTSADLSSPYGGLTRTGQASALYIKCEDDMTTIPLLRTIYTRFSPYIEKTYDANGTWDARFASLNEAQLAAQVPNSSAIVADMEYLTSTYSNDALAALFGDKLGNMITLTYILKPISTVPTRTVRGTATYTATADKLNTIVRDIDALVYNDDPDSNDTAWRVGSIVKQFFNTDSPIFAGTDVSGMDFSNLHDLIGLLINGLLFRDSIINALVQFLYPLLVDLIEDKVLSNVGALSGMVGNLLETILSNNALAIRPKALGDRIASNYTNGKYSKAVAVLRAAGDSWDNVNFGVLSWGVDDAPLNEKAEAFIDGFCAALSGFRLLLVTFLCGDAEYKNNARKKNLSWASSNQFDEYYDKLLINVGQDLAALLRSQGLYTKLIIPLFRVLGLREMPSMTSTTSITGYCSSKDYHKFVDADGDNCLRLVVEPIVFWVTNVLAEKPFETLMSVLPNLVHFFRRTSDVDINSIDDWTKNTASDDTHDNFAACQTLNLPTILDHVYVQLTVLGIDTYKSSIAGFLGSKMDMLGSVNGLLNEVLKLEYVVGPLGIDGIVAYANAEGIAVMPDSFEYTTNAAEYPEALYVVFANDNETEYRKEQDATHTKAITNPIMLKAPYKIPQLQEAKLTSVTTLTVGGQLSDPNAIGVLNSAQNTIDVRNPGIVLMYVLRFVISALGYKYDISDTAADTTLPSLIECFGLDLDKELFQGLNLRTIINNVMLHPDAAICALLEIFYSNENGNYYNGVNYTYGMDLIDYHRDIFLNKAINPTLSYGTPVRYTKYWTREYATDTLANIGELVQDVLSLLGVAGFENGIGPFLENLLKEKVFNNKLMNTLFNTVYQLLGGLGNKMNFDIGAILEAALDVTFAPYAVGRTLEDMAGPSEASLAIKQANDWNELFTVPDLETTDPVTGISTPVIVDADFDWGIDSAEKPHYAFVKTAAALLAPAAFVFRFLFMDKHLDVFGLIDIDSYAGYQYAWIGLLEALSCPNILTYEQYYDKGLETSEGSKIGDANVIYYLLSPLLGLIDNLLYGDTVSVLLDIIPNLLFFVSIGGLNDLLNNFLNFAYVLLDILKPILDGYDLLNGLISNISIGSMMLNLTIPLDLDFNALISDLIDAIVGDSLTIAGVKISLPYIDFHTLCCGKLDDFNSKEVRMTVHLNSAGGADLVTAVLRLLFEVIFMDENKQAISEIVANLLDGKGEEPKLDELDKETLFTVLDELFELMQTYDVPDMLLYVVYFLVTNLTPLISKFIPALAETDTSVSELFGSISEDPMGFVSKLGTIIGNMSGKPIDPDIKPVPDITHDMFGGIRAFFEKLIAFIKRIFHIA